MGSFFGVFVGCTISNYREVKAHPEILAANSAPWYYFGALQSLMLFLTVVVICVIIKLIIRHKIKRKDDTLSGIRLIHAEKSLRLTRPEA